MTEIYLPYMRSSPVATIMFRRELADPEEKIIVCAYSQTCRPTKGKYICKIVN